MLRLVALLTLLSSSACNDRTLSEEPRPPTPAQRAAIAPAEPAQAPWPSADQPIAWSSWSEETLRQAMARDLPILLYLSTPGGDGTFASDEPALRLLVEQRFVAIAEDPWHRPDLARRFGAGGWPTVAALLPDGRLFARALDLPPDNARMYLWRLRESIEKRRKQIVEKVERAQARAARAPAFELDPGAVFAAAFEDYDAESGGFGAVQKFPEPALLEFLLEFGRRDARDEALVMVQRTLDQLLASPMCDRGGIAAFSHTPDWRTPAREFDAADQAGLLRVLLAAAAEEERFKAPARAVIGYLRQHFFLTSEGRFHGRRVGYRSAAGTPVWWTDPISYAGRNAVLIVACLRAAAELDDHRAAAMAAAAGDHLLSHCITKDGGVRHLCGDDEIELVGLLQDQVSATAALLDLYETAAESRYAEAARRTRSYMEENNYDAGRQLFLELPNATAAAYADGVLPSGNGLAADLYVKMGDLARATALLHGHRLSTASSRQHATSALALLRLRVASAAAAERAR